MNCLEYNDGRLSPNIGKRSWKLRKIVCVLLTFLISLLFVGIVLLSALRWNFSCNYIIRVMTKSNYYDSLLREIECDAGIITLSTGLPVEVLDGVFLIKEVQNEVNMQLRNAFQNGEYRTDLENIKTRLKVGVENYLEEKSITPDKELTQSINDYVETIAKEYSKSLRIPIPDNMLRFIDEYKIYYIVVVTISIGIVMIMMIAIYKLNPVIHRVLFFSYNCIFSAALILVSFSKILITDRLRFEMQKAPSSLNKLVLDYIGQNLRDLVSISVVLMFISLIILLTERITKSESLHMA